MCVYIYIYTYKHKCVYIYTHRYTHTYTSVYTYIECACIYIYTLVTYPMSMGSGLKARKIGPASTSKPRRRQNQMWYLGWGPREQPTSDDRVVSTQFNGTTHLRYLKSL